MAARAQQQPGEGVPSTLAESLRPPQPPTSPRSSDAGNAAAGVAQGGEGEGGGGLSGQQGEAAVGSGQHTTISTTTTKSSSSSSSSINSSSTAWRQYLDRVARFCDNDSNSSGNSGATVPPSADILRPPSDLLVHPQHEEQQHGSNLENGRAAHSSNGSDNDNRVLVLLDMNGTLLYRARKPLVNDSSDGEDCSGGAAFVHGDPDPMHYYMRPGASELVAALAAHPRVQLGFYTSMRGVNALPAARFLMHGGQSSTNGERTPEVYDRPFNARDPHGANSWDTTRDLPLIWSTPNRAGWGFGPGSTIMVDDTPRKMRFMDAGLVVVPEFTKECALEALGGTRGQGEGAAERRQREVLPRLLEYLSLLLKESGADVRPFIERNPFHPHPPSSSSDAKGQGPGYTPAAGATAGAPAVRFSFVQAVELVLTTGPLSRERRDKTGTAAAAAAAVPVAATTSSSDEGPGEVAAGGDMATLGCGGGAEKGASASFEGFEKSVEASVVLAVSDLLREATAAAERWGLSSQERDRLRTWSEAAAATT